jgi:hypothetical protein
VRLGRSGDVSAQRVTAHMAGQAVKRPADGSEDGGDHLGPRSVPARPEEDQMTEISPTPNPEADVAPEGRRGSRRSRAGARRAALAVVPLALLGSGALIYQASNAAFTASTSTGSNSWSAGNVFVSNSSSGSALFSVTALKPTTAAAATSKCLTVSYTGNLAANVRMYLTGYSSTMRPAGPPGPVGAGTTDLGDYLRVIVEEGTGTQTDCSDFASTRYLTSGTTNGQSIGSLSTALTAFGSTYPGPSNASWAAPASSVGTPSVKTYKVTYWLPDIGQTGAPSQAALDDLQNTSLSTTFTWEAQNS